MQNWDWIIAAINILRKIGLMKDQGLSNYVKWYRSGIDTDARWGYSRTKGWIFGYKLHMVSSTNSSSSIIVPLSADVTTANVQDNQVYEGLASCIPLEIIKKTHYMVADPGYDDQNIYDLSMQMGFQLVCPVRRYKTTSSEERLSRVDF